MKQSSCKGAALAGTIDLGELTVNRLGFGAMRLCGDYAWGRPRELAACERLGIAFLPWYPLGGKRGLKAHRIKQVAWRCGLTHAALSVAWLLAKSPVMLPIPGTRSIDHLEENVLAAALKLEPEDFDGLG